MTTLACPKPGPAARRDQAEVRVRCYGKAVNGKNLLDPLTLADRRGTRLDLEADGLDAVTLLAALCARIDDRFNEGEPQS